MGQPSKRGFGGVGVGCGLVLGDLGEGHKVGSVLVPKYDLGGGRNGVRLKL